MFKDEEGFLSEWVAYYQMHGFDHIMLFDDGSVDRSLAEVKPWIDSGFVSVRSNWSTESLKLSPAFSRNEFKKAMSTKALLETECKLQAIKWGYDLQVSVDIDEYIVPLQTGETAMDEIVRWMEDTGRPSFCIEKRNFQQAPHTLEPINLLTIEAYQSRMLKNGKMSYYTSVAPKCAYSLQHPSYTNVSAEYVARCCHFHGCQQWDFSSETTTCKDHFGNEAWRVAGKGKKWLKDAVIMNHYSRSLEKFALKQKTWKTASGETRAGESDTAAASSYDIPKFLSRSLGWHHDDVALRYSCQLRELLANVTGEPFYLRPGDFWYRNPEFGRLVSDPDKRGRYGRPNPPGFKWDDFNAYMYKGVRQVGMTGGKLAETVEAAAAAVSSSSSTSGSNGGSSVSSSTAGRVNSDEFPGVSRSRISLYVYGSSANSTSSSSSSSSTNALGSGGGALRGHKPGQGGMGYLGGGGGKKLGGKGRHKGGKKKGGKLSEEHNVE
jgi:hypothetical protein